MTRRRLKSLFILVTFVAAAVAGVMARDSGPTFWTVATVADFLGGTSDGVFISSTGVISAGPQLTNRLTSAPPQIWSLAQAPDGTLWAGTGADGRVIRMRPNQAEDTVFDAQETSVFALARSGNRIYAATSPDGRVYVIDGNAPARPLFDPAEKYIWALAADDDGRVWVGAGNPAVIYRVDADGSSRELYKPPAAHVVSLARDAQGRLLAGTESPGRLYRLDADGRPFVLLDSGLTELRAIAVGDEGTVFAAAIARGDASPSSGESSSVAITLAPPPTPGSTGSSTSSATRRSVVYRIEATGAWESIWETADLVYDLAATDDGGVLAASGPDGRLYKIERSREVRLFTGVDARQITRFATASGGGRRLTAFATANPGRVMQIGAGVHTPARYTSPIRDAKTVATWGLIRWEGAGASLFTRSGNTDKPDDSWSEWTGPYTRAEGEAVRSPAARFLQWRADLTAPKTGAPVPSVTSVTVSYLPRNSRPSVSSITIHPPGVVFQRPFAGDDTAIAGLDDDVASRRRAPGDPGPPTPSPGRRMYQKGLQTIAWKAEDGDSDRLQYSLDYRLEGEAVWRGLRSNLSDPIFVWDTTSVSDGRYVVRITASDSPVNAADRALAGTRESETVIVDNSPPSITAELVQQATGAQITVRVRDSISPIQKLEYSIAGTPWQIVYPADGVADSPEERFEFTVPAGTDLTRIVVRATDWLQNVATLTVPGR